MEHRWSSIEFGPARIVKRDERVAQNRQIKVLQYCLRCLNSLSPGRRRRI